MSKNARLKIALTRTIVNFFVNEDLCAEEISIQGTLCITADRSTIFVTQIAETIVDPNSRAIQENNDSSGGGGGGGGGGGHGHDFHGNHPGSHSNRREPSSRHSSYEGKGPRGPGSEGAIGLNSSASSSSSGNKRLSNHDNSETNGSNGHHANRVVHPLQHLQAIDPHRNMLGE